MLITQLKAKETITSLAAGKKVFIINCHGCKEVRFPEKEAVELQKELAAEGNVTGIMTTDYICNPENMELRLIKALSYQKRIAYFHGVHPLHGVCEKVTNGLKL